MNTNAENNVTKVKVVLSRLPGDNALSGFMGFLDFVGESLNPNGHARGRFGSWMTHFALIITFENGSRWKLERTDNPAEEGGIMYRMLRDNEDDGGVSTIEWTGEKQKSKIESFIMDQRQFSYDFFGKNC
ncbi:predicted protein [Chaetoceros tenuissimus]|uniref:Uncharacterized protein n=1 Tax=Chaetoceros tenuissimus TaxID=426638 RepID=A0AAD3CHC0_9STRA|nr:predicted protein [Chaetoceros tenuissimus]